MGSTSTSWLRKLFSVTLTQLGIAVPDQPILELPVGTLTPDPLNNRNIYTPPGLSSSSPLPGSGLSLGTGMPPQYQAYPCPAITTTDASTANLLPSAVPVPVGKGVKVRATMSWYILTTSQAGCRADVVLVQAYQRGPTGNAVQTFASTDSPEGVVPSYPWAGSAPTTITGAASDGGTQVKIAVANSGGYVAGWTITIAGAVTTGGLALNGQWVVDSVPDGTHVVLRGSVWTGGWTSGGSVTPNGALGLSLASNAIQITATGIKAPAWLQGEAVHSGQVRATPSGTYIYGTSGTTNASGTGPTGTGAGITDGTATADYLGPGTAVPIVWTVFLEIFTG